MKKILLLLTVFCLIIKIACADDPYSFEFVAYGDSHAGYEPASTIHEIIIQNIFEINPDFIIHLGDYTHNTVSEGCSIFYSMTESLREEYPYYTTIGNHDVDKPCASPSWYSFEYKDALFVSLGVPYFTSSISQEKYDWLNETLKNSNKKVKIVFFHNPPYSTGMRGCNYAIRQIDELLNEHKVDIVLNGHTHAYERFKVGNVSYIVFGGAGGGPHTLSGACSFPLNSLKDSKETYGLIYVQVKKDSVKVQAIDLNDTVFDTLIIPKTTRRNIPRLFSQEIEHPLGAFITPLNNGNDILTFRFNHLLAKTISYLRR